jgi:hypothetical protein
MPFVPKRIKESGKSTGDRQLVLVGNEELGGSLYQRKSCSS